MFRRNQENDAVDDDGHRTQVSGTETGGPVVEMLNITKKYGDTIANDRVNFTLQSGQIHVLLGENGAGKTTLMKMLYGHIAPDEGEILLRSKSVKFRSPSDALRAGIGMVHQHSSLVAPFTVAEDVVLGSRSWSTHESERRTVGVQRRFLYRSREIEADVAEASERFGLEIDPRAIIQDLPVESRQRVEILKVLRRGAQTLILDEPTALLGPVHIKALLANLKQLRDKGHSIILVTHKFAEVEEVADCITVLRAGEKVYEAARGVFAMSDVARIMTGRERAQLPETSSASDAEKVQPVLVLSELQVERGAGESSLDCFNLEVHPGEIVGIAGVEGNGQNQLVEVLSGLRAPDAGSVEIAGVKITRFDPSTIRSAGVGIVPQDRQKSGLLQDATLAENLATNRIARGEYRSWRGINWKRVRSEAALLLHEYEVRPPNPNAKARSLSGGNQQKVVLAREFSEKPKALVVDNPSWGLDVGAIDFVHSRLLDLRNAGTAVLLLSLDLEEIAKLCDRIVVLYRGRIALSGRTSEINWDDVGVAMAGGDVAALL